jgi:hypothetical protein
VLTAVAIIPSAPVLIPELAGVAAAELADLRDAVFRCVSVLPRRWVAIGVGSSDQSIGPASAGTFAGYGADVQVALSPGTYELQPLPLCALMTGWVRGQVEPDASARVHSYAATLDQDAAVNRGRELRTQVAEAADQVGVLIVADGANTLTAAAPGGHDPDSPAVQDALDDALATGDTAALIGLPAGVVGRVAFGVLAGLAGPTGPTEVARMTATEHYRGAPYGVGYFAGLWMP